MRGRIVFNGNFPDPAGLVERVAPWLLESRHQDPDVREHRKVLLVTAGWEADEYREEHVKDAIYALGISPAVVGGHDENVQNLSAWHAYAEFCAREPALAARWQARERLIESTRDLYLEKNGFYTALLRRTLAHLRDVSPGLSLADVLEPDALASGTPPPSFDDGSLLARFLAGSLQELISALGGNDARMSALLRELDEHFAVATGLHYNDTWLELRAGLQQRLLSANSVLLFGGQLGVLHRCLGFFRLGATFIEALRRGTSFFAVSAGALLLCDRIIVYNDFPSEFGPRREFQLFDRGVGMVADLQIFPHCMDRIQTDDADNLAYLAHRLGFPSGVGDSPRRRLCVGLNEESFLLVEPVESSDGAGVRATSVGRRDGVYLFDARGRKVRCDHAQAVTFRG